MFNYVENTREILKSMNTEIKIKFLGYDMVNWDPGQLHAKYMFTITNPKGSMTDMFFDSLRNTDVLKETFDEFCCKFYKVHEEDLYNVTRSKALKEYKERKAKAVPTEYDVVTCLEKYEYEDFDDFCANFGYSNDSISALKVYESCCKQYKALRKIFTKEEMKKLAEIQ